jgi:hypothetical protein
MRAQSPMRKNDDNVSSNGLQSFSVLLPQRWPALVFAAIAHDRTDSSIAISPEDHAGAMSVNALRPPQCPEMPIEPR